jgi:gas vesicle protein
MKSFDMNTNGKIVIGFLLGTAIGTLTTLLLAPSTGKTTRKNINKKAKKLMKRIEGFVGTEKKKTTTAGNHVRNGRATVTTR